LLYGVKETIKMLLML